MCNEELRRELRANNVPLWKIGREIGRTEMTVIRWFREPLTGERKSLVEAAAALLIAQAKQQREAADDE